MGSLYCYCLDPKQHKTPINWRVEIVSPFSVYHCPWSRYPMTQQDTMTTAVYFVTLVKKKKNWIMSPVTVTRTAIVCPLTAFRLRNGLVWLLSIGTRARPTPYYRVRIMTKWTRRIWDSVISDVCRIKTHDFREKKPVVQRPYNVYTCLIYTQTGIVRACSSLRLRKYIKRRKKTQTLSWEFDWRPMCVLLIKIIKLSIATLNKRVYRVYPMSVIDFFFLLN